MATNKINILLIDDQPVFFNKYLSLPDVSLPKKYKDYFYLYWIQTPAEAAWLLDAYEELSIKAPQDILELGLPPEILIFDYALSSPKDFKSPNQPSNIVEQLRAYLTKAEIKISAINEYEQSLPSTGVDKGGDRMGCYIGGTFARAFSSYPCAAIPTTAHVSTEGSDAIFFEWLNRKYLKNAFDSKTRPAPTWEELINYAVDLFRKRAIDLINANLIRIPLNELELLSRNPTEAKLSYISIYSKLGCRKLPVEGIFIDVLLKEDNYTYIVTVKKWSEDILNAIFNKHDRGEFYDARAIADTYFNAFLSDVSGLRYELAELVAKTNRDYEDCDRLSELCEYFVIKENEALTNPKNVKVKDCLGLWRKTAKNDYVARWVALMLMVKAEQYFRQYSHEFEQVKQYEIEGVVDFTRLVSDYGEVKAKIFVECLGLRKLENSDNYELPTARMVSIDDVFTLLDPLPENLLTFFKKGKDFEKDATTITNALNRLGNNRFNLKLNINSVLTEQSAGGLIQGEGNLLRLYANEIGYDEKGWPSWLKVAL